MLTSEEKALLLNAARKARGAAYAPYSGFSVGAALLAEDGRLFVGCNVENAAFSPSLCAERVAVGTAVAAGARSFRAIAVIGGHGDREEPCSPCGVCRQTLAELASADTLVLFLGEEGIEEHALGDLLPVGFTLKQ